MLTKPSFRSSLFPKGWRIPKAEPLVAFRRKRNPPNDTQKDQEGRPDSPVGCRAEGNPIKGFPRRVKSCKPHGALKSVAAQPVARQPKPNAKCIAASTWEHRHAATGAVFALDKLGMCHAAISAKLRPRGHPRAACGPPFLLFGLRPRRNGIGVSLSVEREKGSALHPSAF